MSDAHEQLVAALRVIVAQDADAHALVVHALEDVERENPALVAQASNEVPGPYAPNSWSMYGGQFH
jgi:hypothetical protein